jgi:hypothetical protein
VPATRSPSEAYRALRAYSEAVLYVDADLTAQEFEIAHRCAERARAAFDRTPKELKEREADHGCQPTPLPVKRIS